MTILGVLVLSTALPYISSGKLHAIGVTSASRSPAASNVSALAENPALAGVDMRLWFGLFAPKNTPKDVTEKLVDALARTVATPEVSGKLAESGVDLDAKVGPDFGSFIAGETKTYQRIVTEANIKE